MARKEEKLTCQESPLLLCLGSGAHVHVPTPRLLLGQKEGEGEFCSDSLVAECPGKVKFNRESNI